MASSAPSARQARHLAVRAGGGEDPGAAGAGELDRGGADARGAAVHEEALAGARGRPRTKTFVQTVKKVSGSAAASVMPRPCGDRQRVVLVGQRVLGVAAARQERADGVAHPPARAAGADGGDLAGRLEPGQVGRARRRRVGAGALQHVGAVDAGGAHPDQDLARRRLRHPPPRRPQHLRPAGRGDLDDAHLGRKGHPQLRSPQRPAAVGGDDGPVDVGRGLRAEPEAGAGDVLGGAEPAHGHRARHARAGFRGRGEARHALGAVDRAGDDAVHPEAFGGPTRWRGSG